MDDRIANFIKNNLDIYTAYSDTKKYIHNISLVLLCLFPMIIDEVFNMPISEEKFENIRECSFKLLENLKKYFYKIAYNKLNIIGHLNEDLKNEYNTHIIEKVKNLLEKHKKVRDDLQLLSFEDKNTFILNDIPSHDKKYYLDLLSKYKNELIECESKCDNHEFIKITKEQFINKINNKYKIIVNDTYNDIINNKSALILINFENEIEKYYKHLTIIFYNTFTVYDKFKIWFNKVLEAVDYIERINNEMQRK